MQVELVMFKSDGSRRDFTIAEGVTIVGRKHTCDLRIPLTSVSRQHCELTLKQNQLLVRDLGSSNGTFHNGNRVQSATLKAGDELAIGPVTFTVVVDGKPAKVKTIRSAVVPRPTSSNASGTPIVQKKPRELSDKHIPTPTPSSVDEEHLSPTVDLDDPTATLEALASSQRQPKDQIEFADPDDSILDLLKDDDDDLFYGKPDKKK